MQGPGTDNIRDNCDCIRVLSYSRYNPVISLLQGAGPPSLYTPCCSSCVILPFETSVL